MQQRLPNKTGMLLKSDEQAEDLQNLCVADADEMVKDNDVEFRRKQNKNPS